MAIWLRQSARGKPPLEVVEAFLQAQRDQLPLWLPVALGSGIAAWFGLSTPHGWQAWLFAMAAMFALAFTLPAGGRLRRVVQIAAVAASLGKT
jgi:competence protein ComEC